MSRCGMARLWRVAAAAERRCDEFEDSGVEAMSGPGSLEPDNAHIDDSQPSCILCGRALGRSADDQPDWPTGPMCGDCYQARELDNELWWSEDER